MALAAVLLGGICLFADAAIAQPAVVEASPTPTSLPAAQPNLPPVALEAAILEPTQGHPIILRPKEQFRFLMRLGPEIEGSVILSLRHSRVPAVVVPLTAVGEMRIFQERYASLVLCLPDELPFGLYDLVLSSTQRTIVAARSIKVVDVFKTRFRFVHLSDMTIDDASAPMFDDRLVEEINLLAPEFIIATGDYTAWGRSLNDASTWPRVLNYFACFDAPVFMLCGDRDHQASFTQYVAQSPVGTFDYGRYHGILLLDHAAHPLDPEQVELIHRDLDAHKDVIFNMLVTHNDDLRLLDLLTPRDFLNDYLRTRKVRMIITGGSDDWDRTENAAKLDGLDGLLYIRTHQSSTCLRGRATGVSHYRVIEVDGDQVSYVYMDDAETPGIEHSIPVGRLRVFSQSSGTNRTIVSVQNALNQRFDDARIWAHVAKGPEKPIATGGRLLQVLDNDREWVCQVSVDLPDKGGVKVLVTTDGNVPPSVPITVEYAGQRQLRFKADFTEAGLSYFKCDQPAVLTLVNKSDQPLQTYPVVRLNGGVLPVSVNGDEQWPVEIPAFGQVELAPRLVLGKVSQGEHLMQLIFLEDPIRRVHTFPVTLTRE